MATAINRMGMSAPGGSRLFEEAAGHLILVVLAAAVAGSVLVGLAALASSRTGRREIGRALRVGGVERRNRTA